MRKMFLILIVVVAICTMIAQAANSGPYKVLRSAKVGGIGGFDYVNADSAARRLYVARSGQGARITVFNLDTLEPAGEIPSMADLFERKVGRSIQDYLAQFA